MQGRTFERRPEQPGPLRRSSESGGSAADRKVRSGSLQGRDPLVAFRAMCTRVSVIRCALALSVLVCSALTVSCASLHHYAARRLGDALASSGTGFAGDDDPELISAAAPFSLKLMESVLQEDPQHTALLTAAAASFTEFAYAFVQEEADEIEAHDVEGAFARRQRAWGLYRRAREYGLRALDTRHAHFVDGLHRDPAVAAAQLDLADRAAVYWTMVAAAA